MTDRTQTACVSTAVFLTSYVVLFHSVIGKLVSDWSINENYSHGFLVAPLAIYFAWQKRRTLAAIPIAASWTGVLLVVASLFVLAAGTLGADLFLTRIAMIGVLAGAIVFLFGVAHLRAVAFPVGFLLLMVPLPAIVFNQLAFPLQLLASRAGEAALSAAGIPVLREGNVIVLATTTLEVAEACSGIRSLVSLLALGIVYGSFAEPRLRVRIALALATVPIAIAANAARVAGTGIAAHFVGAAAAEGFLHTFSGWLMFVAAAALLTLVHRVIIAVAPVGNSPVPVAMRAA